MNSNPPPVTSRTAPPHPVLRFIFPAAILVLSIALAVFLIKTKKPPRKRPAQERIAVVDIHVLTRSEESIHIDATGTVVPRRAIPLQARVSGAVVAVDPRFVPGGRFSQGEVVLEIDDADYRLTATNRHADLIRAQANIEIERGLQEVALSEWRTMEALEEDAVYTERDRQLALRAPQLKLAETAVSSARAAFDQALLDLARTRIRAPFNAVVRERHVTVGAQITPQTRLAELAGTDAYWARVTLPIGHMKWLTAAGTETNSPAPPVVIESVAGADPATRWKGYVLRRLPDLESQGRQVQLIVEIPHPGGQRRDDKDLPIGAYVRARITGPTIPNVYSIPRDALREGRHIWLMNDDNRLEIRNVSPVWTDARHALIRDGLLGGERLIVSDIGVPIAGMLLRSSTNDVASPVTPDRTAEARDA